MNTPNRTVTPQQPGLTLQALAVEFEDASAQIPHTVVAVFDHTLRATTQYVSASESHRTMTFSFKSALFTTVTALGAAMLAQWREDRGLPSTEWPSNVTPQVLRTSQWLLLRCGHNVVTLHTAKRLNLLAVGGSYFGMAAAASTEQSRGGAPDMFRFGHSTVQPAEVAPLSVPFTVCLRVDPSVTATVRSITALLVKRRATKHAGVSTTPPRQRRQRRPGITAVVDGEVVELRVRLTAEYRGQLFWTAADLTHAMQPKAPVASASSVNAAAAPIAESGTNADAAQPIATPNVAESSDSEELFDRIVTQAARASGRVVHAQRSLRLAHRTRYGLALSDPFKLLLVPQQCATLYDVVRSGAVIGPMLPAPNASTGDG